MTAEREAGRTVPETGSGNGDEPKPAGDGPTDEGPVRSIGEAVFEEYRPQQHDPNA